jgi:hypothetical protein
VRILDIITEMDSSKTCMLFILGDGGVVVVHSNHPNYPTVQFGEQSLRRSINIVKETMDVPVLVGFTVVQPISQIFKKMFSWHLGRASVSPCKKKEIDALTSTLHIDDEKVESLDSSLRSKRLMSKTTTTVRQFAWWATWLLKTALLLSVLSVVVMVFEQEDLITNPCSFLFASETNISRGVSDYAEETYVTKIGAVECTIDCVGGGVPTPVASSGESTCGDEELQEATLEAVAVDVSDENERKVSLRKSLQQPINMTTTLMIEEAPRDTIVLNVSDLDKNASASTETMGLCLLHMNMFEPDVAVNASKSNSSYGGKADGDCILDTCTCTTCGRESSISHFTNLGNITILAHRRDTSIGCLKKLGNITLLGRRRDLKTRLATLKDRIRNVKCKSNPQMKQTNGLLQKNLSDMNITITRRNNTLNATGSDRLTNVMRNILYNKSAGVLKGVKCENESHRKLLLVHLVCQRAIRRKKSLNELILKYLYTLHQT